MSIYEITIYSACSSSMNDFTCICPYCEKRDDCECVLFDVVTGG
jgi:hypothetical protein